MNTDWMMLANFADVREGLVNVVGGGWDTLTVGAPETADPLVVPVQGFLIIRLQLKRVELDVEHLCKIRILGPDQQDAAPPGELTFIKEFEADKKVPDGWDYGHVITVNLNGLPLPCPGTYELAVLVDGNYMGSRLFKLELAAPDPPAVAPH